MIKWQLVAYVQDSWLRGLLSVFIWCLAAGHLVVLTAEYSKFLVSNTGIDLVGTCARGTDASWNCLGWKLATAFSLRLTDKFHTQVQRNAVIQHINQPVVIHQVGQPGVQASTMSSLPAMQLARHT